jgi:uncharacterized protein (DUF1800 family)
MSKPVPVASPAAAERPAEKTPRRSFVFLGALAAASLLPSTLRAQGRSRQRKPVEPATPAPVDPENPIVAPNENVAAFAEWDTGGLSRLVRRVTMGMTSADVTLASSLGWNGYINYQLNYQRIDDSVVENAIAAKYPLMSQPSSVLGAATTDVGTVFNQLRESTIYRSMYSQRHLYQRMVELWTDHFNQDIDKVQTLLVADQRDVIRKYAMSTFPQLLKASAHSASMMVYLDQNASSSRAPNQNYAREIMELHTLGVDGGYTQDDVAELSRVLTGWTVGSDRNFVYSSGLHDTGSKTVLGHTIAGQSGAAGQNEGEQMLDILVNHPSTAKFIAKKMLMWMVTPAPTDTQISTIASVYRATGGDIKAMLRAMLNVTWISQAPMKLKRPYHFAVSALRSMNPAVTSFSVINAQLATLGHQSFSWDTPDGYPDKLEYWAGNVVPRWQFGSIAAALTSLSTINYDIAAYRNLSPAGVVDVIDVNFFGGEIPAATKTGLNTYLAGGTLNDTRIRETIALAIGSYAFQWY